MIDPMVEIDRLKNTLRMRGLTYDEAEDISNLARQDVNDTIQGLVGIAIEDAANAGMIMGAEEFVEQLQAVPYAGSFRIGTTSGKIDFSEPSRQMLPDLLKNAKTAKDGSKYKVIPVGVSGGKPIKNTKNFTTLMDVQRELNNQQLQDREQRRNELMEARRLTFTGTPAAFSGLQKAQQYLSRKSGGQGGASASSSNAKPEFRTASSKQNPATDWVMPARPLNMQMILDDINNQLQRNIQDAVSSIVSQYEALI